MDDKHTELVKVYVQPELKALMQAEANKAGVSLSSLLRVAFVKLTEDYEYVPGSFLPKEQCEHSDTFQPIAN